MKRISKWLSPVDKCDICKRTIKTYFVDGNTKLGGWALMCPACFKKYGFGLGVGRGQKYDFETKEKLEG
jgi:hypothetical protein